MKNGYTETTHLDIELTNPENPCPICAWTPKITDYRFVWETGLWRVVLAPNQSLIGRCVVHLKRHAGSLADLTPEEILEWRVLVEQHEQAVRSAFGAAMFNWSCYLNHSYREDSPDPHVHWWAVPRYNRVVEVGGLTFDDPHFENLYDHYRWEEVTPEVHREIAERIQQALTR